MVGSMAAKVWEGRRSALPNYVAGVDSGRQGIDTFSFGSAYLGQATHPFTVAGDPAEQAFEVKNLSPLEGTEDRLADRAGAAGRLRPAHAAATTRPGAAAWTRLRGRALDLMTGDAARTAFDLNREPDKAAGGYGLHRYGQRCLLARRLVERGASWVTMVLENATPPGVSLPKDARYNWDSHAVNCHIFEDTKYKLGFLDQAISALIDDLYTRGLDRRVLLVVTGEFGRTPRIEYTGKGRPGRDHWPQAMSILVSGGGLKMGQVVGSTNAKAEHPKDRPLTPNDLWATVFHHLDIDYKTTAFPDATGRPMPMLPTGEPIRELL